ncbi:TPA: hypothetical protein G8M00_003666 [Salmonella enterica]|uniref:Uncharacterized protein n=1 Tax=Salmonella enterica TaxID=28901 RepID=A0A742KZ48_SALER|nr:hypothetical protein [Salmonella enterica]
MLIFLLDPFLTLIWQTLAIFGTLCQTAFFVKRQYWRGLAYRFAQIYLAKNFYRGKRKRGGLVPRS